MEGHIGSLTDILNCIVRNDIWQESQIFSCVFSDINFCLILFRPKLLFLAFSFHKNLCYTELMSSNLHLKMCKIHKSQNLSYRLSVSVSADMEKFLSVIYRYRPIRKLDLSVTIGIGRYGNIRKKFSFKGALWFEKIMIILSLDKPSTIHSSSVRSIWLFPYRPIPIITDKSNSYIGRYR